MTPEAKVKKDIKKFLDSLGCHCWYFMPMMMGYGRKGIPDIIGCYVGFIFAIEVKAEGGKPTPWQKRELEALRAAGAKVAVVTMAEEVEYFFKEWFGVSI